MKNILITGATGFIGKHLVRRLTQDENYKVNILVKPDSNLDLIKNSKDKIFVHQYRSNYESVDELFNNNKFDYIFHLAAVSSYEHKSENIANIIDSNIKFGTFILEAAKKYGTKYFINTSTYWQNYQDQNYEPICLYAATKKAFEDIIDYYCMDQKIKAISLKLYDVYGYDDHRNKLLNTLFKKENHDIINLTQGEQRLYMVFIDDVIEAYINAMNLVKIENKKHAIYGVYGKEKHSLKEMIQAVEEVTNQKLKIDFGAKSYNEFQIMDSFGVEKMPKWEAKTSLKEGLKIMLKKYE